MTDLAREG